MFNAASDIHTRQIIWVARKVGQQQRNSHTCDISADGLSSADWAGLHTSYEGWQGPGHRYWCNPEAENRSFPA